MARNPVASFQAKRRIEAEDCRCRRNCATGPRFISVTELVLIISRHFLLRAIDARLWHMNDMERWYHILGLEPGASPEEVGQAYKDLVFVWHPDRIPQDNTRLQQKAVEKLKEFNLAYEQLRTLRKVSQPQVSSSASNFRPAYRPPASVYKPPTYPSQPPPPPPQTYTSTPKSPPYTPPKPPPPPHS
jgi:hypothetical protein